MEHFTEHFTEIFLWATFLFLIDITQLYFMCPAPKSSKKRNVLAPKPPYIHPPSHYSHIFIVDALLCAVAATLTISLAIVLQNPYLPIVTGLLEAKLGLIAHEASHGAAPKWLGWLYDAAMGSKSQWIAKHNKQHHIVTNTLKDPDIQLAPLMRIHPSQPHYWFHKYQHIYQFPLFCAIPFGLRLQGVIYLHMNCELWEILQHWILAAPATFLYLIWPILKYGRGGIVYFLVENFTVGLVYGECVRGAKRRESTSVAGTSALLHCPNSSLVQGVSLVLAT
jgi:fatty acid desaturase